MKIALITYHRALNYGAVLQTYATCEFLKRMGHEVQLIDVRVHQYHSFIRRVISYLNDNIKRYKFYRFRHRYYPVLTRKYVSIEQLRKYPPVADLYMVGSDQVFNTKISADLAPAFFLDFGSKDVKRMSFSSSFGEENWYPTSTLTKERLTSLLKNFGCVTIRERTGCKICKEEFGIDAYQTIDPTLLLYDFSCFLKNNREENSIVSYCFGYNRLLDSKIQSIAKTENLKVRHLYKSLRCTLPLIQSHVSVEQWIRCIAGAKYVITDSFHGLIFCLINHRQFVVLVKNSLRATRIKNILSLLGLESRMLEYDSSVENITTVLHTVIDYSKVDVEIDNLRKKSVEVFGSNI